MIRLILLRVLEEFFRHRLRYIMLFVLPVIVGVLLFVFVPASYFVRGTIYVQRESLLTSLAAVRQVTQFTTPAQATLSEVSSLINTDTFALAVLAQTNLRDIAVDGPRNRDWALREYRRSVYAMAEGTNIVVIAATHDDPILAQQMAAETMNAYVAWRVNFERADSETAQRFFADQMVLYEEQLAFAEQDLRDYLLMYPDPIRGNRPSEEQFEIARLQRTITEATSRLTDARAKEEDARLSLAKVNSESFQEYLVIDAPSIPNSPPSLLGRAVRMIGFGVAAGLGLSIGWMILMIASDRSFYFPTDVRYGLRQPTLAMLPMRGPGRKDGSRLASSAQAPDASTQPTSRVSPAKS
ncbi:MAG: hypothetical protein AB4911_21615 [Oscillochloridaceae bacterium umkhey_bin13]